MFMMCGWPPDTSTLSALALDCILGKKLSLPSTLLMILHCISTLSVGNSPAALSADSMMASAPRYRAVATSLTSALVGMGVVIMLSSICVATTTGQPLLLHLSMMDRWRMGTSSCISSTPRSPRATMTPSDSAMMSSRRSTAEGFSIFAMTKARSPTSWRSSTMSDGFCTKERATQSTPMSRAAERSDRSLRVRGEMGMMIEGVLTPFLSESLPPTCTSVSTHSPRRSASVTISRTLPSSRRIRSPLRSVWRISGWGSATRVTSPSVSISRSRRNFWPLFTNT
mmetsp:Transcript_30623/g.77134  ORF Transcript_30623/g.77134 Transcript_30623/m.77134 type:complete len:283 (-) Transcript_30623:769-1617(-)